MRTFVEAATGLPGILLTAALVVAVCFWLLVAVGAVRVDSFDADADLTAWSMGGVPVTVALSLLTVVAWLLNVVATALLTVLAPSGTVNGVLHLLAPAGSLLVAWRLTCLFVRPLHRHFPEETGPLADHRKHRRRTHR
ncbi:hypothetical protein OHB05_29505 [Streptomyces sp. NBC_00638]|uniref:hypothetical protein n=1 Tax=Streptomyces sp. NBC_00638 TaxID=2975794 RepID=UPI00225BDB86|nr:hypothetical protein [Streptomyces sp. NBC_00638]MCX5006725.1 hypothetical protein [Streptomyces sp. NBC_00638]